MTTFYTIDEAAQRLTVSRRTLFRLIEKGRIRVVHPSPGTTRITEQEIENYTAHIEGRRKRSAA